MKLFPALAGAVMVLLLAGAAVAASQVSPEAPGLLGAIAHWFACGDPDDVALLTRDLLDEAEFASLLGSVAEAGQ